MEQLAVRLKQRCAEEGFDLVGIARARQLPDGERLASWLAAGMHGEMDYLARTASARSDPRRLLADCRSLVVVGMSYRGIRPEWRTDHDTRRALVSRYAWGRDYHKVLKRRLVRLGRWLSSRVEGCAWRTCVDTAPLLERSWAAQAGLGWIGANSMLINRRLGSELFLGALLTDLELPADSPTTSHCGRCSRCIEACPTGALVAPGVLDARRCVAYLTVEHRGEIARELEPLMGAMVAGCDVCQDVCPWNRRAPQGLHEELAPIPGRVDPPLADLEALDDEALRRWRAASALTRIKDEQLRRNLRIARSNLDLRERSPEVACGMGAGVEVQHAQLGVRPDPVPDSGLT